MIIKEFIQLFRNPRLRVVVMLAPLAQCMVFGYAVSTDIKHVPTAIYDQDNSPASRELIDRFTRSGYFDIQAVLTADHQINQTIDQGKAAVVIKIGPDFGARLAAGKTAPVQIIIDGTDSNTARVIMSYVRGIIGSYVTPAGVQLIERAWFNENLTSRNFYVPGVIAMIVMLTTLLITSMAVVREKESGTMEQIVVTPIAPWEFIIGKTVPAIVVGYTNVLFVTGLSVFWFEIPVRGSLLLLLAATTLYLMSSVGIGLLISTVSRTQQQAMMSTFFFYFPALLLSGFIFPIANMPEPVQYFTLLNPLRYFLVIIRGTFLKGNGLDVLWPEMLALFILGCIVMLLAVKRFRKHLA